MLCASLRLCAVRVYCRLQQGLPLSLSFVSSGSGRQSRCVPPGPEKSRRVDEVKGAGNEVQILHIDGWVSRELLPIPLNSSLRLFVHLPLTVSMECDVAKSPGVTLQKVFCPLILSLVKVELSMEERKKSQQHVKSN